MAEFRGGKSAVAAATPTEAVLGREIGGFGFENAKRNAMLVRAGLKMPGFLKTGTTIVGVVYNGGIVLGADTRATEGSIVADKNCEKIHYIAPNIYCCGAGTAADTENTTQLIASQLELLRLQTGCQSRVVTAMTVLKRRLFRYQGHVSAALVLGGVDHTGPHLYTIYPHGSTDKLPFVTMGSGSLAAMSVFETGYKDDLTEEEAKALVHRAIRAGVFNDLGSGSNVDLTVIRAVAAGAAGAVASPGVKGGAGVVVEVLRGYEKPNDVTPLRASVKRPTRFTVPVGATATLKETFKRHVVVTDVAAPASGAGGAAAGM